MISEEPIVGITKIVAAEQQIKAAIKLFFDGDNPIPVYTLAAAAREVLTIIACKKGIRSVLHGFSERAGVDLKSSIKKAHEHANFFKHADRDPGATLSNFSERDPGVVLFIASHDFRIITGGSPIECQVFDAWWFATQIPRVTEFSPKKQEQIRMRIRSFPPGIRSASLSEQKRMGKEALDRVRDDPRFVEEITRDYAQIQEGQ